MTSLTFNLIVILIAAPIWLFLCIVRTEQRNPVILIVANAMAVALTLSVAWGIRLIVLNL